MARTGRPKKCVLCEQIIKNGEVSVPYKNRYAHETCFNASIKALSDDKQKKLAEKKKKAKKKSNVDDTKVIEKPVSEEECEEKRSLYKYIRKLENISEDEFVSPRIATNIQNYIKRYGFTYKMIEQDLYWYYEIRGCKVPEDDSLVGIVPYIHKQAQDYYSQVEDIMPVTKETFDASYNTKNFRINPRIKFRNIEPLDITKIGDTSNE